MKKSERLEILQKFLAESPNDSFSKYALALEYSNFGETQKAIILLEEIQETDPDYLPLYYLLGKLLEQSGEAEKAKNIYLSGLEKASSQKQNKIHNEIKQALEQLTDE